MQNSRLVNLLKMVALSLSIILIYSFAKSKTNRPSETSTRYDFAMGTSISAKLYDNRSKGKLDEQVILDEIKKLDCETISWRNDDSELAKLNKEYEKNCPYKLSNRLYIAINESLNICKDSNGALDITIRPLANLWGIEDENANDDFQIPVKSQIDKCMDLIGYEYIMINGMSKTNTDGETGMSKTNADGDGTDTSKMDVNGEADISKTNVDGETGMSKTNADGDGTDTSKMDTDDSIVVSKDNITIDLGATGKGYALDIAAQVIEKNNVGGAMITAGGSVLVYGQKSDSKTWKVAIRDPNGTPDDYVGYINLDLDAKGKKFISTSGCYEKYVELDGVRYHHILDSKTGFPAKSGLQSVSVICDNGLISDGLSTACFVLGKEKSMDLLKKYNAEAIFIDDDNNIICTDNIKDDFIIEDNK